MSKKRNVLSVWKEDFSVCCRFYKDNVATIFWEVRQSAKKYLNQHLVIGRFLEKGFEASLKWKRMFWALEKTILKFFASFWVTKLKPLSKKGRQSVQNYVKQTLVIGSFLQRYFEGILSSKTNVLIVGKGHFLHFWKFLTDEVETIFWESEAKHPKLFK